jgi:hypothetical protein
VCSSKREALSSNPSTAKKKKKRIPEMLSIIPKPYLIPWCAQNGVRGPVEEAKGISSPSRGRGGQGCKISYFILSSCEF